ncbi:crossover junction endodeoxyribonuclease RuvA [Kosakonia radicincitans DSM 16656]|uniref:RusA family crossover junction endodeoxyribonuclease n=1 Tax=Kosakonia radicincitans TaxID=283686 RepID=UPI000272F90B|nr:crossover junction endodeoxyribonuclease RuvA [Kosakonia radicincitans DSM 16656]
MIYPIVPMGKPRMTRSDKWKKRPEVMRYRAFCDEVRICGVVLPVAGAYVTFILPMPASWSKKKRAEMNGKPHQVKPDKDNLEKALLDALFENDAHIWDSRVTKLWGESGQIIIEEDALCVFS